MKHHYDIHGLTMRIDGITEAAVPDLNTKLHHFVVDHEVESPDIDISIGPFEPDRRDCLCLDRRYWARPGHLVLEESDKGLSWTAQLSGLDPSDRRGLSIMFEHGPGNRRKWRWRFFPDLVMHLYVLWPVLECELARRGLYLVHAGGVCRDGKALLVAGRGGVNKTAVVAELVRRGWQVLGDDFVLLRPTDEETEVLSFPTSPRWFQYQLGRQQEAMGLVEQLRFYRYMKGRTDVEVTFAERAELEKVVVLNVLDGHNGGLTPVPLARDEAARVLELNCRMERTSYIGHGTMIGRFLDAYAYIVPETTVGQAWSQLYEVLLGALEDIEVNRLDVPGRYRSETVDAMIENSK